MNKSAITDHVAKENHVTSWLDAKILEREGHWKNRQVCICIPKHEAAIVDYYAPAPVGEAGELSGHRRPSVRLSV